MRIECHGLTDVGQRKNNEDRFLSCPELGLFVVADGMGGYARGEEASRIAVETLEGFFRRNARDADATWPFGLDRGLSLTENLLQVGCRLANQRVCEAPRDDGGPMGTTVAALAFERGTAVVAHVGDSRVYRLRQGELRQLTVDHSLYQEMVAARGVDEAPSRREFQYSNIITRALGTPAAEPDLRRLPLQRGDVYLLCSDGLFERLELEQLRATLLERTAVAGTEALLRLARQRRTRDNNTAVVVRVIEL